MPSNGQLEVLRAINKAGGQSYGYEIVRKSRFSIPLSGIYVVLKRLEKAGLIESVEVRLGVNVRQHMYRITDAGIDALPEPEDRLQALANQAQELKMGY